MEPNQTGRIVDSAAPIEEELYKGICINCECRENCGYRTTDGAVWFCEEYSLEPPPALIPETLLPPFGVKHPAGTEEGERKRPEFGGEEIDAILQRQGSGTGALISMLAEIQAAAGFLPEKALRLLSEKTGRSMVDLYGIATFYLSFSLKPRGRHTISVCQGTACHVRGAPALVNEFKRQLKVNPGETTHRDLCCRRRICGIRRRPVEAQARRGDWGNQRLRAPRQRRRRFPDGPQMGNARCPIAAAMVGKTIGRAIDENQIPVYVERFGNTRDGIFVTANALRRELGDAEFEKVPSGALGLYTYYERLAQGLRQLMAGSRKFAVDQLSRKDLAALTREAADISGIRYIMEVDEEEVNEILRA